MSRAFWRHKILACTRSRSGQVAVVMIVAIAIGLILFAASINLTMMAQSKTFTMKAASASAASTASFIASYGQREYVETMGRRLRYCKSSGGGFWSLLTLIVLIVVAVWFGQYQVVQGAMFTAGQAASIAAGAMVGAVMEAASIIIAASIDPGISDMWNRMQNANLSMTGQVVERGVQTALQAAVTDQVKMPDLYDMDGDGLFGYPAGSDDKIDPPNDTIGRFSYYNTKRYLSLRAPDTAAIVDFVTNLHNLVLRDRDNWGLWDPVYYPNFSTKAVGFNPNHVCYLPPGDPNYWKRPAECDYCCDNYNVAEGPLPNECVPASGALQAGVRDSCAARSPFQAPGSNYPYVYDFSYEDSTNAFMSFREQLGRDDEHHLYHTNSVNPNWHSTTAGAQQTLTDTGFFLKDVVGHYQNPPFALATPDIWIASGTSIPSTPAPRLFSFLYKMKDWGANLSTLTYANYQCHYCDNRSTAACPGDMANYLEDPRLVLPFNPTEPAPRSGLRLYSNNLEAWCVNNVNRSGSGQVPPLLADNVSGIPGLFVANDACAINPAPSPAADLSQYVGGWKSGADRYCSNRVGTLYSLDCPKHGAITGDQNPQCGQPGAAAATLWPDDMIDEIIYGLPALFDVERNLWQAYHDGAGATTLASTFMEWYGNVNVAPNGNPATTVDGVADWIEPPCPDPNNCPGSFTKLARPGTLWIWRAQLQWLNSQIQNWLVPPAGQRYSGTTLFGSGAAWCIPPTDLFSFPGISSPAGNNIPADEALTFDVNNNGIRGDVADVIACLKWNADNTHNYSLASGVPPATGNADKFQRCVDQCGAETCTNNLPRSLVPAFYTLPPFKSYPGDEALFTGCIMSSTITECSAKCDNSALPSGPPYTTLPAFQDPALVKINNINSWCSGPNNTQPLDNACNGPKMLLGVTKLICNNNANANQEACICSWANDCAGIVGQCGAYCASGPGLCDYNYRDKVTDQILPSRGSCADANWPNFRNILLQSADEARIQEAKFRKRAEFLQARYDEAMALSNDRNNPLFNSSMPNGILTEAINKITEFLDNGTAADYTDSPAERLIQARMADVVQITGDLPSFGLYVWQDEDPVNSNPGGGARWDDGQGYWHAVKVEVRIPRRCAGNCITNEWPKVFSRTSGGGFLKKTKICYTIINRDGRTKARVIRYDQDKDLRGLVFPGGQPIWQARMSHPQSGTPDPTEIRATCRSLIDADLDTWLHTDTDNRRHLGAAFMFNQVPDLSSGNSYALCWQKVHQSLLDHGIQSEACAEYHAVEPQGFQVEFVPCDNW